MVAEQNGNLLSALKSDGYVTRNAEKNEHVRYGSEADLSLADADVRIVPEADVAEGPAAGRELNGNAQRLRDVGQSGLLGVANLHASDTKETTFR